MKLLENLENIDGFVFHELHGYFLYLSKVHES
jgi:hypothetical protein